MAARVADETAADELELFIENDYQLYRSQTVPIETNLLRKMVKGTYDHGKAVKLWEYLAESGAKKCAKDVEITVKWSDMFDVPTRRHCAKNMADGFLNEVRVGGITPADRGVKGTVKL